MYPGLPRAASPKPTLILNVAGGALVELLFVELWSNS
jgi:hypothetical protein